MNFTFVHTPSLTPAEKQRIRHEIRSTVTPCRDFAEALEETGERVRLIYQERGYFKVQVADPEFKAVRRNGTLEQIDVKISVEEGRQYRLKDISFRNGTVFPNAALRRLFPISSGDIFNRRKISLGLEEMRKLYAASGFINSTPVPDITELDEDAGLISLKIDIDEGVLFRWGELIINGVESEPGARQRLLAAWQTYRGTPYNGAVALRRMLRDVHALPSVKPEDVFELSHDDRSGRVNVYLTLVKPPKDLVPYLRAQMRSAGRPH